MPAKPTSAATAEHYSWGIGCDAWYLVRNSDLNIIEERMPPGTAENRHLHHRARQFFYVLSGTLTVEIEHVEHILQTGQGVEIAPGDKHRAANPGPAPARFLVVSQPPSHDDRVDG